MHPADIKAALQKVGLTQRDIAHACAVSTSTVAHVIHGRGKSAKVASFIASTIGIDVNAIWPGTYGAEHARRQRINGLTCRVAA